MNVGTRMNMGAKPTNGLQNSFIPASNSKNFINTASTAATNAANGITNIVKNVKENIINSANAFVEPITQSFNSAKENTETPFLSISIVVTLGICIVLFIILFLFYDQIAMASELLWHKLKKLFGYKNPIVHKPKPEEMPPAQMPVDDNKPNVQVDNAAINTMMPGKNEVFNISQNKYKYSDAEPLCKAFGAELATYDQVKDAWSKGADWCNYGWVKGQAAIYPTQQSTYNKMQAGPEDQRTACGVAGINGGYFDNPELKFGVTCYGQKPSKNDTDERAQMTQQNLTPDTIEYDHKVMDYKAHMNEIPLKPFSQNTWSQ